MSCDITNAGPILKESRSTVNGTEALIRKMKDDPICLRASIGGTGQEGFYFVYRGRLEEVRKMLKTCWLALENFEE